MSYTSIQRKQIENYSLIHNKHINVQKNIENGHTSHDRWPIIIQGVTVLYTQRPDGVRNYVDFVEHVYTIIPTYVQNK